MKTILITGGTGLVGKALSQELKAKGYAVRVLSTNKQKTDGITAFYWNTETKEIDKKALENITAIVHLAGAGIADERWTDRRKKIIVESRVASAQLLFEVVQQNQLKIDAFVSASAIGYYGAFTSEKIYSETDAPATDFLGETCRLWEQAADRFNTLGIRTVKLRTGVVLANPGGALGKMLIPVKLGIGSALGSGKQYMPWIHIKDLCAIYIKAIEDEHMNGAYNAVAPDPKTNNELTHELAHTFNKPFWFPPVPAFILKLLYGQMADMFLKGSRVSCDKLIAIGFRFQFTTLQSALSNLFKN